VRTLDIDDLLDRCGLSTAGRHVDMLARRNAERWLYVEWRLPKL
jgi:hypothetical protein